MQIFRYALVLGHLASLLAMPLNGQNFMAIRAAMIEQLAPPPTEPVSLYATLTISPDLMNNSTPTEPSATEEPALDDQYRFISTLVNLLSAATDARVLEIYGDTLKALSDTEKKEFALQLAMKVGQKLGRSLGNPLQDNEYRRGPKQLRHFHLAGPLIITAAPGFTERYLKDEFWRIWRWCKEYEYDSEELSNMLEPLNIYKAEFFMEGEQVRKVLQATIELLGKDILSEHQVSSIEAIYTKLTGSSFDVNVPDFLASFLNECGQQGASDVFLTSLRLGVPLHVVIQKLQALPNKPETFKSLFGWIHLALNQDEIVSDTVTEEMRNFLREFAVISASCKDPVVDYTKLKRPEVIRAVFGAIWNSAEDDLPAVHSQFIRMMETMGYKLVGTKFTDTLAIANQQLGPILYIRLGNNPIKTLIFYLMVKVLRMEVAVWPIIQTQNKVLIQASPALMIFYWAMLDNIPEALEYYESCHRALLQTHEP